VKINITVTVTPAELMARTLWLEACELLGMNPYVVNEGQMDSDAPMVLEAEVALKLGLLPAALEELEKHRQRTEAFQRLQGGFVEALDEWTARHDQWHGPNLLRDPEWQARAQQIVEMFTRAGSEGEKR
jgi:hypothetical protein